MPRAARDGLTIRDLLNKFLNTKRQLLETGELVQQTLTNYRRTCKKLNDVFGPDRLVDDLSGDDFEHVRVSLSKTLAPISVGVEVVRIRTVFKYAYEAGLVDKPIRFGPTFKRPSKKVLRKEQNKHGRRMLEAEEVRRLLSAAGTTLRALLFLAVNGGFGNTDVGRMPLSALDLDAGWINFPREKTGIMRRCPLWKETVEAIRASLAVRPSPADPANDHLAFLTSYGKPWARDIPSTAVGAETNKLFKRLDITGYRVGLYRLRRVFRTIADRCKDQPAAIAIMGHSDTSMSAVYVDHIEDERLVAITDRVHDWVFDAT